VLSGRGLCGELITRPEESYQLWCVVVCDLENLKNEEAMTRVGSQRHKKKGRRFLTMKDLIQTKAVAAGRVTMKEVNMRVEWGSSVLDYHTNTSSGTGKMVLFDAVVPKNSATFPPPPTSTPIIRQIKDTKGNQGLVLLAWF